MSSNSSNKVWKLVSSFGSSGSAVASASSCRLAGTGASSKSKTDFDDLLRDGASEPQTQVNGETVPEVEVEPEPEPEPEEDILGVAEAREKLLAAVAALEQPPLSDEEDEARALAEAIENERRQLED